MSEIHPTDPIQIAEAYKHSNEQMNTDMRRVHEFIGEPGHVSQEAADDFVDYLKVRPFEDENGKVREANGRFTKGDTKRENEAYESTHGKSRDEQSLSELISDWAKAENEDDKTAANDIQDSIMDRVLKQINLSDDHKQALLDKITGQKDALKQKTEKPSYTEDTIDEVEPKTNDLFVSCKWPLKLLKLPVPQATVNGYNKALSDMRYAAGKIEEGKGQKLDELVPGITDHIDQQMTKSGEKIPGTVVELYEGDAPVKTETDEDAKLAAEAQAILDTNGTLDGITPARRGKLRNALRNMKNRSMATAGAIGSGTLPEHSVDREKMSRGEKLVLAGLGAAALGTMAYLAYRGVNNGGGSGAAREAGERGAGAAARNAEKARDIIDNLTPGEQRNFGRMIDWEQNWIQEKGLDVDDPKSWSKAARAFRRGIGYMGKLKAARSGGDLPHTL
ncbi:MAG: hypothetical protein AAB459_03965 [Patescibacteria group bacterium]